MNITSCKPSESDIHELATFVYQMRRNEIDRRGMTIEELENMLNTEWKPIGYVLARSVDNLIGLLHLYQIGESDLIEINPGSILSYHPLVAPDYDFNNVSIALIERAKQFIIPEGFNTLYIDIPWDPNAPQVNYDVFREHYSNLGFEVIQQVRQMNISLPTMTPGLHAQPEFELAQVQTANEREIYQCHHDAYMTGEAQYFFKMDESERHADFKRIFALNIREHPASLVLTHQGRVVGYCLLFTDGTFSEVMSLVVHPDFRRRGLGKLLMSECIQLATGEGITVMHLIVDVNNKIATALYRQFGFKDIGGNMTFKWKA
jgi:ribosomal protein S18 acetylase RimI-like enzyme